jgi:hypothetical protein
MMAELNWLFNPPVQKWNTHSAEEKTISFFQLLGKLGVIIHYQDFPMATFHNYIKRQKQIVWNANASK